MSRILSIITNPSPVLREKSTRVDEKKISSPEFKELCLNMAKAMKEKSGSGLAAPQIGQNIRLILVSSKSGPLCMINPKITKKSWRKEWGEEGCLSIPGIYGQVKRHKKLHCKYLDQQGKSVKITAEGLLARIIQHEIDHLNGVLFIDKAKNIEGYE